MEKINRAKHLFQKYLDRTASEAELEEMFKIFEDRTQFSSVYELFEKEWDSQDTEFDLSQLTLEQVRANYRIHQQTDESRSKWSGKWLWWSSGIAAGIIALLIFIWNDQGEHPIVYETAYGETKKIVLEDHTIVTLNANSRLVWDDEWQQSGIRKVELTGEAFFEVRTIAPTVTGANSTDDRLPFQVVTPDLRVNVYGTSFNVESRREKTEVYLESGVVELELKEIGSKSKSSRSSDAQQETKNSFPDKIMMKPGDAVRYSLSHQSLEQMDNGSKFDNASWTEGSLYFEDEKLVTVLQRLEDIYGKKFEVTDTALLNRNVNLGLPFEDWSTVLGVMTLSLEMEIKEANGKIILDRKIE